MTIQFPCDLAIANLGIVQVMNFIKCFSRSSFLVNCVPMPVNLATVVKTGVSEQIETVLANLIELVLRKWKGLFGRS